MPTLNKNELIAGGLPEALAGSAGLSIRNLKPSNTLRIRAAMASTSRNALVACNGVSTTAGQTVPGDGTQAVTSWPMQLARLLQNQGINAGANNVFGDKSCYGKAQNAANFVAGDARNVLTGTAGPTGFNTIGGNGIQVGNAAAGTWYFTPQDPVTKFDIYWRDGSTGSTFSTGVDGGAVTNVSTSGTASVFKTTVNAGARGIHTLNLAFVLGNPRIVGINAYDDTSGRREICFLNWGISGARSAQLLTDSDPTAGILKAWTAVAPDLTILDDWAINDWRQGVSISTFAANLAAGITQAKLTGDCIVTTPLFDGGSAGSTPQQDDYAAAAVATALAADVPVLDVRSGWVSYGAANSAGLYSDTVHPTVAGYSLKAASMAELFRRLRGI